MIKEISTRVRSTNGYARGICLGLFITSLAVFLLSGVLGSHRGVVSLIGVIFMCAGIMIYTRYIAPEYYYDVTFDADGVPVFVARQITGRRASTLCRVSLSDVTSVKRETAAERRAHKTPYGVKKYSYTPTLNPAVTYRISTVSPYESAEIVIEVTDEYADMLREYVNEAKNKDFT